MLISAANDNEKIVRFAVCITFITNEIGNAYISEGVKKELTEHKRSTLDLYG